MDFPNLVFSCLAPITTLLASVFGRISESVIERASRTEAEGYARADLNSDLISAIENSISSVSKSALLISNCVATTLSSLLTAYSLMFILDTEKLVYIVFSILFVIILFIFIGTFIRVGTREVYLRKMPTFFAWAGRRSMNISVGRCMDYLLILVNAVLIMSIIAVYWAVNP
ncbi:hypothetical protein MXMO3_00921 [Maritalea myrionectae]|uniref:Uncharacterized protein n=1 Tax=Maritalea myrionectae TaxID=454601 RepID=A0A2R4MBP2_9HYPH|nr:hypothetical protein MXMO3_00921 [Maritalea myrionectae]